MTDEHEKVTFSRYDNADYLKTREDMAEFLAACFEEAPDDVAFLAQALGTVARAYGMTKLSRETGISREALYRALSPEGNPSVGTFFKVIHALGLKLTPTAA